METRKAEDKEVWEQGLCTYEVWALGSKEMMSLETRETGNKGA